MPGLVPFNRRRKDLMNTEFEDFQNMLDDFFAADWTRPRSLMRDTFKIDVKENDSEYTVEAELPGVTKEDVNLSIEEGRLSISVNKEEVKEDKNEQNYIHRERRYTSMQRNVFLRDAAEEGIKAKLEDGVLTVSVPKKAEEVKSKAIEIE
ncbi:Hsp20/alpha crystallin family protein [Isachenkonia alkalipeptolytica]|uniref:Hsp20/alpha crystallin family protein n=1 Tax=Isachenkonia alkalipeptolytica TaxID=2565777 RepID=A0AA43XMJ8_9CLOT|nr:Hsp20/alpha crystallin family protein [Isachenkonia alkalipeptolytica]NBG89455.1 Hsp20/alpha crystallin family protein [Isachenkonia alkalipeptolytica]